MKILPKENIKDFVFGGNALFTIKNEESGNRFTYKVRKPKDDKESKVAFVSVLSGSDNYSNYSYLGTVWEGTSFYHGKKSKVAKDAQSAQVFKWAFPLLKSGRLPEVVNIYHEGKCGCCGRRLTVPESIEAGIGPICRGHK